MDFKKLRKANLIGLWRLAHRVNVDLDTALRKKWNEVSERVGSHVRLTEHHVKMLKFIPGDYVRFVSTTIPPNGSVGEVTEVVFDGVREGVTGYHVRWSYGLDNNGRVMRDTSRYLTELELEAITKEEFDEVAFTPGFGKGGPNEKERCPDHGGTDCCKVKAIQRPEGGKVELPPPAFQNDPTVCGLLRRPS